MRIAETERLVLRPMARDDLPRLAQLIGEWDVIRWLTVIPFPFSMRDAETLYHDLMQTDAAGEARFLVLQLKNDPQLIGGIGLQSPRAADPQPGEVELGYWLGSAYWGHGLMTEAACQALHIAFARRATRLVSATVEPENIASQRILRHLGMQELGFIARPYEALRGGALVSAWQLTRETYERTRA